VYGKNQRAEVDLAKASAYWSESLSRTKRLPSYESWLNPPKPARNLTGDELEQRQSEHEADVEMMRKLMAEKAKGEEESMDDA